MLIIVFIQLILVNSSVIRRSETKVDEQGRKYHYSEKYEEEFSYEIQKRCSDDDDSDNQLEFENDLKYDEDLEGYGEGKNVDGNEEIQQQRDDKQNDNEDEYQKEDQKVELKREKQKHQRKEKEVDDYVLLLQNESLKLHLTAN